MPLVTCADRANGEENGALEASISAWEDEPVMLLGKVTRVGGGVSNFKLPLHARRTSYLDNTGELLNAELDLFDSAQDPVIACEAFMHAFGALPNDALPTFADCSVELPFLREGILIRQLRVSEFLGSASIRGTSLPIALRPDGPYDDYPIYDSESGECQFHAEGLALIVTSPK